MKYIYVAFVYLLSFFPQQINASGPVILGMDEWLDPSLKDRN